MEPTTVTTIFMILFAIGVITWTLYLWFSDWQPAVRRYLTEGTPRLRHFAEVAEELGRLDTET